MQLQTQVWLERHGYYLPSVLTTPAGSRGELARSLRLDLALDDRLVNCLEIISASNSKALLVLRASADSPVREAAEARGIGVVPSLAQALDAVGRLAELMTIRRGRLVRLADWFHVKKDGPTLTPATPAVPVGVAANLRAVDTKTIDCFKMAARETRGPLSS